MAAVWIRSSHEFMRHLVEQQLDIGTGVPSRAQKAAVQRRWGGQRPYGLRSRQAHRRDRCRRVPFQSRGEGASRVGPRPRGTVNLASCRSPIVAGQRCQLGRDCRGRPRLLTPSTSRVVALPTGGAAEWKVRFT